MNSELLSLTEYLKIIFNCKNYEEYRSNYFNTIRSINKIKICSSININKEDELKLIKNCNVLLSELEIIYLHTKFNISYHHERKKIVFYMDFLRETLNMKIDLTLFESYYDLQDCDQKYLLNWISTIIFFLKICKKPTDDYFIFSNSILIKLKELLKFEKNYLSGIRSEIYSNSELNEYISEESDEEESKKFQMYFVSENFNDFVFLFYGLKELEIINTNMDDDSYINYLSKIFNLKNQTKNWKKNLRSKKNTADYQPEILKKLNNYNKLHL